jgi:hypothetical protein
MARGRKPIEVTPDQLQIAIGLVETGENPPATRSQLWQAIEDSEWAKGLSPRPLTAQVAMLLAKRHNLVIETPVGKRGISKGQRIGGNAARTRKRKGMPEDRRISLLTIVPPTLHNVVERAAAGNLRSAVKLKCLECSGFSKKEVSLCTVKDCHLWSFRPYKGGSSDA